MIDETKITVRMRKVFVFAMDHVLPTAFALSEDGDIIVQHAGNSYEDAVNWLIFLHRRTTLKEFEIIILDKELVRQHLYYSAPILSLGEDVANAFKLNQEQIKQSKKDDESGESLA